MAQGYGGPMGRVIAAVIIVTTIAGGIFYWNWYTQGEEYKKDQQQIAEEMRVNAFGAAPHVILLEATDPIANGGFDFAL